MLLSWYSDSVQWFRATEIAWKEELEAGMIQSSATKQFRKTRIQSQRQVHYW